MKADNTPVSFSKQTQAVTWSPENCVLEAYSKQNIFASFIGMCYNVCNLLKKKKQT